jgi:hypothetical protein
VDRLDRIEAACEKFNREFGHMPDEWTEMFAHAAGFARGLIDTNDHGLCEEVIKWLEESANLHSEY